MPPTTRLGLDRPATTDAVTALRTAVVDHADTLDTSAMWRSGTRASRGAATLAGDLYMIPTEGVLSAAVGGVWVEFRVKPEYVTSLPGGPIDGQEVYVGLATNQEWHFRYRSASAAAEKWEFVGGAPLVNEVVGQAANTGGYAEGGGPFLLAPFTGLYRVEADGHAVRNGTPAAPVGFQLWLNSALMASTSEHASLGSLSNSQSLQARWSRLVQLTVGDRVSLAIHSSSVAFTTNRQVALTPVRVV
jgi:hypothetical protein